VQATATALPVTAPGAFNVNMFVIANWGEYAMTGLLAVYTATALGIVLAAYLAPARETTEPYAPSAPARALTRTLPPAAAVGLSLAGIYAITAAVWHGVPNPSFLRWTVLPALPTVLAAAAIGPLAHTGPASPPVRGWTTYTPQ
jgi:hypothetical protein